MRFASPEYLLLLPLLAAAGWYWRSLHLEKPLRVLVLLVLVLALAHPELRRQTDGLDLWVLVDCSDSASGLIEPRLPEWESILMKSKHQDDRIHWVDFAGEAVVRGAQLRAGPDGEKYDGPTQSTRLASAIRHALSQMPPDRAARLLTLTDGYSTEPLDGLAERLSAQGVPLDYRLVGQQVTGDYRITGFNMPRRVQPHEAFLVEVGVAGTPDANLPVDLFRNGQKIARRDVKLSDGVGQLRFIDRLNSPGAARYEAFVVAPNDPIQGNNRASQWIEVLSGPRVVLVTDYLDDPLAEVLKAQGFEVQTLTDLSQVNIGTLSGAKVVMLNNVPAYKLDRGFLNGLEFFVQQQGGGLVMIGGTNSFASGGYFGSSIDPLLPVSMELKQEHRKVAVAMAIIMDRSGSMGMSVPGTGLQKMDLANEGAARAVELLGDRDLVSVFAVDTDPHVIAPMSSVGKNRGAIIDAVRRIRSMGGGIYCYTGMKAGFEELKKAPVGQRHLLLFADAADAEEHGDYTHLIPEMVKEGCTVSVIGMGTEADSDAEYLKDVARLGGGRAFFNANPAEIPSLFAQETVAMARSAFLKDPVAVKGMPGSLELTSTPMPWPAQVDAYNLSYLRPGATVGAISSDDYTAPLLAFWQRGAGRVAAVSFPLGGQYSKLTRAWKNYGDLAQSLTRWLMGETTPPGIGLRTSVDGSKLRADLYYDSSWNDRIAAHGPELVIAHGSDKTNAVPWERMAPGHFQAVLDLEGERYINGAVKVGDNAFSFGPVNAVTNPEWQPNRARVAELKDVSTRSGGGERVDLSDVWNAPHPPAWRGYQKALLIALLLLVVFEAWQTRANWRPFSRRVEAASV